MSHDFQRRTLLKAAGVAAVLPLPAFAQEQRRFEPEPGAWRSFELTTTVNVADAKGGSKVWLPVPDVESEWQQPIDSAWSGNATSAKLVSDPKSGTRMLYAEFAETVTNPTVVLTSRLRTRGRAVD